MASNGKYMEEIWKNIKGIVYKSIKCIVRHKLLRTNPNPEYYNKKLND
jgi:hypothetical protein